MPVVSWASARKGLKPVDERALRVLEFHKIRERLVEMATYPPAKELAAALVPSVDADEVTRRQAETEEMDDFLSRGGDVHLSHLADVRPLIRRAGAGGVLEEEELADIAHTVTEGYRLRQAITAGEAPSPLLREKVAFVADLRSLAHGILSRLTEEGRLRDDASPELNAIRRQRRTVESRLRAEVEEWVRRGVRQGWLQEASFTVRGGRYVLPVRHDRRDRVPGIVHDRSASGQTLFVEPDTVVELGNRLRELELEEEKERQRILARLSQTVGARRDDILHIIDTLAWLDFTCARARLGRRWRAVRPEMSHDGELRLMGARHPLLIEEQLAGHLERVVPLDLRCEPGLRVLLITGPNTGGKTVALKTVGLLALMFQAGLPVPAAPGSRLPLFNGVYADIGDEQSIEQSLSTFSSHMSHIISIMARAGAGSLVLLDELGAGTDPEEGAALAMALLDEFARRGCLVLATTHYGTLKSFVHRRPDMANASVEFDAETLAPTYRLIMGLPGRSNALDIARRLGLPEELVETARRFMGSQRVAFEDLLKEAEAQRWAATAAREEAEAHRREAERARQEWEAARAALEAERQRLLQEARAEARELLRAARRDAEAWIARFRRLEAEAGVEAARRARAEMEAREAALAAKAAEGRKAAGKKERRPVADLPIVVGGRVQVLALGQEGIVVEGPSAAGEVVVQVGPMRMTIHESGLRAMAGPGAEDDGAGAGDSSSRSRRRAPDAAGARGGNGGARGPDAAETASAPRELHLRGMTVDEALLELEKFLDRARWIGWHEVRIVHGKGTGTLRRAVADYLKTLPFVHSFSVAPPQEGGHGVTVVVLD